MFFPLVFNGAETAKVPSVIATTLCVVPLGCEKISVGNTSETVQGKWLCMLMPLNTSPISVYSKVFKRLEKQKSFFFLSFS